MRVGFDASACKSPHSPGVRRVASSLLEALEARGRLEVVRLEPPAGLTRFGSWRRRELPRLVKERGLAGIHSFVSSFAPGGPGRRVQTVHELPWKHGDPENAGLAHRFWAFFGPRRAARVVVPTRHVAKDLGNRANVRVIPWGVSAAFVPEPAPGQIDEVLLERYRLGSDPIVLCPGAVRPKKNLAAVLRGVARLVAQGRRVEVVVTGGDTPTLRRDLGLASQLGLAGQVTTLDRIEEQDLPGLYRLASLVPVLSGSEGFGLPVLEALACGTPAIVPADSAQEEAGQGAAFAVDASSEESIATAFAEALDRREELRYTLPERLQETSWDRAAAAVEALWEELGS